MITVKFDKSVKYRGVRYPAHVVFEARDEDATQLKEAGAVILSTKTAAPQEPELEGEGADVTGDTAEGEEGAGLEDATQLKEELLEYTVRELTEFAQKRGIDLQGKTRKADIYNIIVAALD